MAITDNGIVIFMRGFPSSVTESVLCSRLQPYLSGVGIQPHEFEVDKPKAKGFATMHVTSTAKGEKFLLSMKQFPSTLSLSRHTIHFERHSTQDGGVMIKDRKFIEKVVADAYVNDSVAKTIGGK
jgi:hypothetical protein